MTQLVFDSGAAGPGTHALIIGVGGYPYLEGGTGTLIKDPLQYGNLGQLTSPPRSALALVNFLYECAGVGWQAPLATIDLLISPAPDDPRPGGPGVAFKDATIDSIREAFGCWKERCGSNPDNVAVFYFCGHGLQSEEQILLASDFGRFADQHFAGAFAFESTRNGFLQCLPETQCFFVDACREVTPRVVEGLGGVDVLPLLEPKANLRRCCKHDLTLQSSAPFESAFALPRDVSYFTAALIAALKGGAASTDEYGNWVVRTYGVTACIDQLLQMASGRPLPTAKGPGLAPTVLCRLGKPPDAELILGCDPQPALAKATLSYKPTPPLRGKRKERIPPTATTWTRTVPAGFYTIGATFGDATFRNTSRTVLVEPPSSPHTLQVRAL